MYLQVFQCFSQLPADSSRSSGASTVQSRSLAAWPRPAENHTPPTARYPECRGCSEPCHTPKDDQGQQERQQITTLTTNHNDIYFFYGGDESTLRLSVGSFCLKRMSQTSRTPSIFTVKKTEGLTGLQQASVRNDIWYLRKQNWMLKFGLSLTQTEQEVFGGSESYLVHIMDDSLMSSDQIRAVQSPTVRKFLGKKGFLCRA